MDGTKTDIATRCRDSVAFLMAIMRSTKSSLLFRKSGLDVFPLLASLGCGWLLVFLSQGTFTNSINSIVATAFILGTSIWWISNTVSHIHLHTRLFKYAWLNTVFSFYLTLLTSIPQTLWRYRHLQHHAQHQRQKFNNAKFNFYCELAALICLWVFMAVDAPSFAFLVYLPGFLLGLCLCQMQGYFEHRINGIKAPQGASFYNSAYNFIFFNDGYHAEHHMNPKAHWSQHKNHYITTIDYPGNDFPPILGWLGNVHRACNKIQAYILIKLENQIFYFPKLQTRIIANHKQAVARLMFQYQVPVPSKICVIGGGGFPRTVILLRQLYPLAKIMVVDKCLNNLAIAKTHLQNQNHSLDHIQLCHGLAASTHLSFYDLVLIPLGFNGDKKSLFSPSPRTSNTVYLLHDWIWHSGERGIRVSWWLLKRINYFRVKNIP